MWFGILGFPHETDFFFCEKPRPNFFESCVTSSRGPWASLGQTKPAWAASWVMWTQSKRRMHQKQNLTETLWWWRQVPVPFRSSRAARWTAAYIGQAGPTTLPRSKEDSRKETTPPIAKGNQRIQFLLPAPKSSDPLAGCPTYLSRSVLSHPSRTVLSLRSRNHLQNFFVSLFDFFSRVSGFRPSFVLLLMGAGSHSQQAAAFQIPWPRLQCPRTLPDRFEVYIALTRWTYGFLGYTRLAHVLNFQRLSFLAPMVLFFQVYLDTFFFSDVRTEHNCDWDLMVLYTPPLAMDQFAWWELDAESNCQVAVFF